MSKDKVYEEAFRTRTLAYAAAERATRELTELRNLLPRIGEDTLASELVLTLQQVSTIRHDLGISVGELTLR